MKYIILIYGSEAAYATMSQDAVQAEMQEYFAFTAEARTHNILHGSEQLQPTHTATTVRMREGKALITDGPFAETKEQLGGYYILDCKDLDEAIAWAQKIPGARAGSIEIRPLVVFG